MDRKLSDEQIDRIAKNLLRDFAPDDETLDEIAGSPRLWWNVRSSIEAEKGRRRQSFFARFRQPVPVFGALAVLVCLGLTALFVSFKDDSHSTVAEQKSVQSQKIIDAPEVAPSGLPSEKPEIPNDPPSGKVSVENTEPPVKLAAAKRGRENPAKQAPKPSKQVTSTDKREETKTDFIALSYAAETDSGQIVRVKVPSSMMVSLGVKTTVEKESEMVSAEVVIGDDGMARAIRFIR